MWRTATILYYPTESFYAFTVFILATWFLPHKKYKYELNLGMCKISHHTAKKAKINVDEYFLCVGYAPHHLFLA